MKGQKVFSGKGRRVIKSLSVDERILLLRQQLGETRQQAVNGLRWLEVKIQARQLA